MTRPLSGSRWVVRAVSILGFFLAAHILIVAIVLPASSSGSQRPWPLSLKFPAVLDDSKRSGVNPYDGSHNFGAVVASEETVAPTGSPWYAPRSTDLNNLTAALDASQQGVYGFIFNSSTTPAGQYGTYNWCNMPHVRKQEYRVPDASKKLAYVELIHRHHKRTPYAANSFPQEPYQWDCTDAQIHMYSEPQPVGRKDLHKKPGTAHYRPTFDTPGNPFLAAAPGWRGSCQFPQLTEGGLEDAWQHGADLYGVYHDLLGFLPDMAAADAWLGQVSFRITNNPITSQTVTMVLGGMAGFKIVPDTPLVLEPASYDSLEPQYTCAAASTLFGQITSTSGGTLGSTAWSDHLEELQPLYSKLDAASGVRATDIGFHASVDHYYDNLSARQCHGKPAVAGIAQDVADTVFRVGQWEYSRMYRDDARSLAASTGAWGVWVAQLAGNLRAAMSGVSTIRYRHNVAHDGSVSRLLSILQVDEMVWPGMGSEVVFELWQDEKEDKETKQYYVRVMFSGKVLTSSHPDLGVLDMLPVDALLRYIDGLVGPAASLLPAKCNGTLPL